MKRRNIILLIGLAVVTCVILIPACAYGYTVSQLGLGRLEGVYPSPEEGMRAKLEKSYLSIQRVEIDHSAPMFYNSKPQVWYVIANVWADRRADGHPLQPDEYNSSGSFYLKVHDGWIHLPEPSMPELISILMNVFDLEG